MHTLNHACSSMKLSGPVENKNKDENAKEQATKQILNKLHEAQVNIQMPAEKDIQVEQTKEKIHGSEVLVLFC
jgi:hypothetical protein